MSHWKLVKSKPSSNVAQQVSFLSCLRVDITAILLCVEQLMWSVCTSIEELITPELPSETSRTWLSIIHSLCNQLLNVLVILTAPLSELYRYHRYIDIYISIMSMKEYHVESHSLSTIAQRYSAVQKIMQLYLL